MSCRLARSLLPPRTNQSSMLLLAGTERVSRASWAHSASGHLSAASMHASEVQTPDRHSNACPPSGCSGRIRTVHASMVHLLLALPHSPLQGSPPSSNGRRIPDRLERAGRGAAIHAISARSGHAHHRDMHTLTPRTPHGAPGAKKNRGSRVGDAAPAGSRGELVLRGRHVCIEAAALMGEREGERGAPLPSSFLNGERRGQRRPSTLPHHPHTRHTFMLSTQPPSVEGTRSIALTREAL